MIPILPLPRLSLGVGVLASLPAELALLGMRRPFLVSDRGLERAGAVSKAMQHLPQGAVQYLDVVENPTLAAVDATYLQYKLQGCDGVVALGGGSVLDTGKLVAVLAGQEGVDAAALLNNPGLIGPRVAPLIAIPTTLGTGSESSPVAAVHREEHSPAAGIRSSLLVPRTALCDPALTETLPPRLIAATGIDAISHCIEGFFAEPAHPIVDALALDGLTRAFANIQAAMLPEGNDARAAMMAAAFAGGAAIHKGLGPAHAIAVVCGDQGLHHGVLIAATLPRTVALVAEHAPAKAARLAASLNLERGSDIAAALRRLCDALGLPASLREAGYKGDFLDENRIDAVVQSHFNRTTPYVPTRQEYVGILRELLA